MRMTTDLSQNNGKLPRTVFINRCKQLSLFVVCKHKMIQDILQDMSNDKCPCSFFRLGFVCDGHACKTKERQITFCKKTVKWQMAFAILQFSFSNSVNCHYIMCSCYVHVRCCKPRAWKLHLQHMGTWQIATIMFCLWLTVLIMVSVLSSVTINDNLRMVVIISYFSCLCYSRFCACF